MERVAQAVLSACLVGADGEAAEALHTVDSNLKERIDEGHGHPVVQKLHTLGARGEAPDDPLDSS